MRRKKAAKRIEQDERNSKSGQYFCSDEVKRKGKIRRKKQYESPSLLKTMKIHIPLHTLH